MPGNSLRIGTMGNGYTMKAVWKPTSGPALNPVTSRPFDVGQQRQLPNESQNKFSLRLDPSTPLPTSFAIETVLPPIKIDLLGMDGNTLTNDIHKADFVDDVHVKLLIKSPDGTVEIG